MRRPLPSAACNVDTNLHLAAHLIPPMQFEPTNSSLSDAQDILYHIVQYLDPDRSSAEDLARIRQTLLSTAFSCRNFTRPALAALWRFLPSDKPLTDLLVTLGLAEYSAFLDGSHPTPLALRLKGSVVSVSSAVNRMNSYMFPGLVYLTGSTYTPSMEPISRLCGACSRDLCRVFFGPVKAVKLV